MPCIRCARRSTVMRTLSYGQGQYELDLCKRDSLRFSNDVWTWLNTADDELDETRTACDRCGRDAASVVPLTYEGVLYITALCDPHADLLQHEMLAWLRDSRLLNIDLERPRVRVGASPAATPAAPIEPLTLPAEAPTRHFWPTKAAITAMAEYGISWVDLIAELTGSVTVVPARYGDVDNYLTDHYSVLVSEDGNVVGLLPRDERRAELVAKSVTPKAKVVRKGKRGGIGNVQPRTVDQILDAVRAAEGWAYEAAGSGHWKVRGPDGQLAMVAATPSDYRSPINDWARLKRLGLTYSHSA